MAAYSIWFGLLTFLAVQHISGEFLLNAYFYIKSDFVLKEVLINLLSVYMFDMRVLLFYECMYVYLWHRNKYTSERTMIP